MGTDVGRMDVGQSKVIILYFIHLILTLSFRENRVLKLTTNEQITIKRNESVKESKISPGKIVTRKPQVQPGRQVSETDLYLLNAIEKLVYRVDFMEKRLRKLEEMLYYVMAGNRMDHGKNYRKCYENY